MSLPALDLVGQVVRSLCQANACGSVVMRLERCAYLQFNAQLVCFGLNELGASSITGLFDHTVHTLPQCFTVDATAQLSTQYLLIDDQYFFDLFDAETYKSMLRGDVSSFGSLTTKHELLSKLTRPSAGFAPLLQYFTAATGGTGTTNAVDATSIESELLSFVMPAIAQLADQLRVNCAYGVAENVQSEFDSDLFQKLVGAGPGLTPSGDDFLCGVFTALQLSGFSEVAKLLWTSIRNVAERSTTRVSFALLEQSALGESGERLDAVIKAYYDYPATAANEFQRLVGLIGETSGWDWLTGFVLCGDILWHNQTKMPGVLDLE